MAKNKNKYFESTQEGEQSTVSDNETSEKTNEVIIEKKPNVVPAKEEEANQEILNTPKPAIGMKLTDSWKHPSKLK